MKRTLFAIVFASAFALRCSTVQIPDDRCLAMLQGSVREIVPSGNGEMMRFDTLGRLVYSAEVDANLNATGNETNFLYFPMEDGREERIEMISLNGKLVNRRRCAVTRTRKGVEMRYFKIRVRTAERIFTDMVRTVDLQGGKAVCQQDTDHTVVKHYYSAGSRLPYKSEATDTLGRMTVTEYEYPDIDSLGNWLTRLSLRNDGQPLLESRMIRYYK